MQRIPKWYSGKESACQYRRCKRLEFDPWVGSIPWSRKWFNSVQLLSHVQFFATPWTSACQASLSITNSWSLLKLISIKSVMPSNHLSLCHPLLLLPSILPGIRVFSNESVLCIMWPKYWSFSCSISLSKEQLWKGSGNPLQCSCLENFMDRGAWWATVHGVALSQTQLSMRAHTNVLNDCILNKQYLHNFFIFIYFYNQ